MNTAKREKHRQRNDKKDSFFRLSAAAISLSAVLLLSLIVLDCERYESADASVPAAITFTAPEKPSEKGFWELFSETVVRLFIPEV